MSIFGSFKSTEKSVVLNGIPYSVLHFNKEGTTDRIACRV